MKRIITVCLLVATASTARAQNHWDENTGRNVNAEISSGNKCAYMEMEVHGRLVTFRRMPELQQEIRAVITDATGSEVAQKAITPLNNTMNIHSLRKGKMYFVTIVSDNIARKAFTLRL